jgi:hypothetical protein
LCYSEDYTQSYPPNLPHLIAKLYLNDKLGQERVTVGGALPRFYMHHQLALACLQWEEDVQLQARTEERIIIFVSSRAFSGICGCDSVCEDAFVAILLDIREPFH